MIELIHYSAEPLRSVRSVDQTEHPAMKPQGLWFSVEDGSGDGWREWCESERFELERLACRTRIDLDPAARVLRLDSTSAILRFHLRFATTAPELSVYHQIDWRDVAREYQGIVIAPYQWSLRLDDRVFWYYGWDCANGCVWDAAAVRSVETMPSER